MTLITFTLKERLTILADEIEHDRYMIKKINAGLDVFGWNSIEASTRDSIYDVCSHMEDEIRQLKKVLEKIPDEKEVEE